MGPEPDTSLGDTRRVDLVAITMLVSRVRQWEEPATVSDYSRNAMPIQGRPLCTMYLSPESFVKPVWFILLHPPIEPWVVAAEQSWCTWDDVVSLGQYVK
jgi:hypothetical protein